MRIGVPQLSQIVMGLLLTKRRRPESGAVISR